MASACLGLRGFGGPVPLSQASISLAVDLVFILPFSYMLPGGDIELGRIQVASRMELSPLCPNDRQTTKNLQTQNQSSTLADSLVNFHVAMISYFRDQLMGGERGFTLVQFNGSPSCGDLWRQQHEATGHMASTVREQREMNVYSQLTFSFLFNQGPSLGAVIVHM